MNVKMCKIVCLIATLNESATIAEVIQKTKPFVHQIVVIDGFSQDMTFDTAAKTGVDVIYQEGTGKGLALRTGIDRFDADIYVTIDGDATYDPEEMGKLLRPILDDDADMVIGSRLAGTMEHGSISRINAIGNRAFNFLINWFFGGRITDSQSGFRAFNRRVVDAFTLSSQSFEIETELTVKALQHGFRVLEIPITYGKRRGTPSKLSALNAGSRIFHTILKCSLHNPSQ